MGEERATDAAATQHPAADQKAQDPAMILVFALALLALLVLIILVFALVVFLLMALVQEVRNKQTADAPAAQQAASNEELQEAMLLIPSLLALFAKVVAFLSATAFAEQTGK
jgi:heme/copper-type cytochrome/quinol oxidase subunit 2